MDDAFSFAALTVGERSHERKGHQTMPFASATIHSKLSKVKLDTSGGTLTDISDAVDKCDGDESLELGEVTTFGATSKAWLAGFADGKFSIGGPWSRALHTHMSALKTAFRNGTINSASFEYGPEGVDVGDIKQTCEVILVSYKKTSSVKDPVRWESEFQITGDVTEGTY
jgi:hypothetical protein